MQNPLDNKTEGYLLLVVDVANLLQLSSVVCVTTVNDSSTIPVHKGFSKADRSRRRITISFFFFDSFLS